MAFVSESSSHRSTSTKVAWKAKTSHEPCLSSIVCFLRKQHEFVRDGGDGSHSRIHIYIVLNEKKSVQESVAGFRFSVTRTTLNFGFIVTENWREYNEGTWRGTSVDRSSTRIMRSFVERSGLCSCSFDDISSVNWLESIIVAGSFLFFFFCRMQLRNSNLPS